MKVTKNIQTGGVVLECISNVTFGSIVRLQDRPDYWPAHTIRGDLDGKLFMLGSEYYRDWDHEHDERQLLLIDLSDGSGIGVKQDLDVEVVHKRGDIMKISKGPCINTTPLKGFREGEAFRFKYNLASKHSPSDIFIRAEVCSSYRPVDSRGRDKFSTKIPVVNLSSGAVAYVESDKPCVRVEAEVCVAS